MTRSLPKMMRAANDPQLVTAFEQHLEETRDQVEDKKLGVLAQAMTIEEAMGDSAPR